MVAANGGGVGGGGVSATGLEQMEELLSEGNRESSLFVAVVVFVNEGKVPVHVFVWVAPTIRNPVLATRNHNYCTANISFWPVTISVYLTNIFLVSTIR